MEALSWRELWLWLCCFSAARPLPLGATFSDVLEGPGWRPFWMRPIVRDMGQQVFGGAPFSDEGRRLGYFYEAECQKFLDGSLGSSLGHAERAITESW
jgi:hypothetical protein